jgi:hypothetical protein
MASPFPGMDPWLEDFWRDIHARLVIYAADHLQGRLPGDLRARVEERVVVEPMDDRSRNVYPDVRVVERGRGPALAVAVESGVAVAEPLVMRVASEPMTETFIEIIDVATGKRVVTVLEVLSLANKLPGDSRNQYRQKRKELMAGGVSLVEIDLQTLIDQCYRNGGYDDDLDYARQPNRRLDPDDVRWADELLQSQGRR